MRGLLASQVKNETKVSDVTLANIEALADIELPPVEVVCSSSPYDGIGKCLKRACSSVSVGYSLMAHTLRYVPPHI